MGKVHITGFASLPVPGGTMMGALGWSFPLAQPEWSPLQGMGSCFSQDRWEKAPAMESHITPLMAYMEWTSVL